MANSANKVEFGISDLYVGTYTVSTSGTVTLGTPYHQKGAVSFSPEEQSDKTDFYADNIIYWSGYSGGSFEGDLEVAKFDDQFKVNFLGYGTLSDGGVALVKGAAKPNVYLMFSIQGDVEERRCIMYNATLGAITRSYSTIEASKEPATETLNVTVMGDDKYGLSLVSYAKTASGYSTLFTNPPVPSAPTT